VLKTISKPSEMIAIHAIGNNSMSFIILIPAEALSKIKKLSKKFSGIITEKYRLRICCDECVEITPLSDFKISIIDKSIVFTDIEQWMENN
jgi:hypothetical protein